MSQNHEELLKKIINFIPKLIKTIRYQDTSDKSYKNTLIVKVENITAQELKQIILDDTQRQELIELISKAEQHCKSLNEDVEWQKHMKKAYEELSDEINDLYNKMLPTPKSPEQKSLLDVFIEERKSKLPIFTNTKDRLKDYTHTNDFLFADIFGYPENNIYLDRFASIIRAFVINKDTSSINNTKFACQLLINLNKDQFESLLAIKPEVFEKIRENLQNNKDPHTLLTLIALETRVFMVNTGKMTDEFAKLRTELNTHQTDVIGEKNPTLDITKFQETLNNIKSKAPSFIMRLITALFNLFSSKPKSFFEKNSASELVDKIKSEETQQNTGLRSE